MAINREDILSIDLLGGTVHRSFLCNSIGEGDADGNVYGVRIFKGDEAVSLTGCTVTGYFIRADQSTIVIQGMASGNTAAVSLPDSCYAVEGNFTLAIKVTGSGITETMRVVDGCVINTTTSSVYDPGGAIPDINALMAVIERAEDAAEAINSFIVTEELISGTDYRLIINIE